MRVIKRAEPSTVILIILVAALVAAPLLAALGASLNLRNGGPGPIYTEVLTHHRSGILITNFSLAFTAAIVTLGVFLPLMLWMRAEHDVRGLILLELIMIIPFFFHPALRLFSVRRIVALGDIPAFEALLYSDAAVVFGMSLSTSALFVLPVSYALKQIPDAVLHAAEDLGLNSARRMSKILLPLASPGIAIGFSLFLVTAWFSSLEFAILGRGQSVLGVMEDLVGVKKYDQVFALVLLPTSITLAILVLLMTRKR